MVCVVFIASGFAVRGAIDYFIDPDASKVADKNFKKNMDLGKKIVSEGIYKNKDEISDEFNNLRVLTPKMLSNPSFFPKNKSFFIQIVPDTQHYAELKADNEMHPHYYWLKKAIHKKREHLFPYIICARDFKEDIAVLEELVGVQSYRDLNDLQYILVNSDKMKMPVGGRFEETTDVQSSIVLKFAANPLKIKDEDELFELLDGNRNQPIKYFFIWNPNNQLFPGKQMTLSQKMFRKFFYENSSYIESETVFAEITNKDLAEKALGLINQDTIIGV